MDSGTLFLEQADLSTIIIKWEHRSSSTFLKAQNFFPSLEISPVGATDSIELPK